LSGFTLSSAFGPSGAVSETEQAVTTALAFRGEKPAATNPYIIVDLHQLTAWAAFHLRAAEIMTNRGRLLWAEQELQQIIEGHKLIKLPDEIEHNVNSQESAAKWRAVMMEQNKGEVGKTVDKFTDVQQLIPFVLTLYADICAERDQFDEAAMLMDLGLPFVYSMSRNGIPLTIKREVVMGRIGYYQSKAAAARGDWNSVKETVDKALNTNRTDSDLLIMRWLVEKNIPDLPNEYKLTTSKMITEVLGNIRQNFSQGTPNELNAATHYNEYAWLASNTNREHEMATHCITVALKFQPENWAYQDTFSYVLASKGEKNKAIENQKKIILRYPERTTLQTGLKRIEEINESNSSNP
jgi:tetratricopeptide (TPR) repeat protein